METPTRTKFKEALKEVVGANYKEQVRMMTAAVELIAQEENIKPYSLTWHTPINNRN